jgi:hypothetical protein
VQNEEKDNNNELSKWKVRYEGDLDPFLHLPIQILGEENKHIEERNRDWKFIYFFCLNLFTKLNHL